MPGPEVITCQPVIPGHMQRAGHTVQSPVGCAVTPPRCIRRVLCSMNTSTYRRFSSTVSTCRKSTARIPAAWACRNCRHVGPEQRGAGSMPAARRISHTVDGATAMPSFASSPWIRRCPQYATRGRCGAAGNPPPLAMSPLSGGRRFLADPSLGPWRADQVSQRQQAIDGDLAAPLRDNHVRTGRRDLGPPARQAGRTARCYRRADGPGPHLWTWSSPRFWRYAAKSKSGQDCGWNRCVTRTRRYRSSGRAVADDAVRTRSPNVRSATPVADAWISC